MYVPCGEHCIRTFIVSNGCPTSNFVRPETVPPTKPFMEAPDSDGGEGEDFEEVEEDCASGAEGFGGGSEDRWGRVGIDWEEEAKVVREGRRVPPHAGVKDDVYIPYVTSRLYKEVELRVDGSDMKGCVRRWVEEESTKEG